MKTLVSSTAGTAIGNLLTLVLLFVLLRKPVAKAFKQGSDAVESVIKPPGSKTSDRKPSDWKPNDARIQGVDY